MPQLKEELRNLALHERAKDDLKDKFGRIPSVVRRYDTTVNCGPDNPLTMISRGPIKVRVLYGNPLKLDSEMFVELRLGKRRQRTGLTAPHDHSQLIHDILDMLGFEPEVFTGAINYDDDYGEEHDELAGEPDAQERL